MKKFKTESKRVLDLMIHSIYTNKEIFLRELLSNCSDANDKLYYKSLTDGIGGLLREDFFIKIEIDTQGRKLIISDNGIGMTADELENNLGVIAHSGSLDFKAAAERKEDIDIIGQFGVGFYSSFMVSDRVEVLSKAYGTDSANLWVSKGADGYTVTPAEKQGHGTVITLTIKENSGDEDYDKYLDEDSVRDLVKRYSDYIRYPIRMQVTHFHEAENGEEETEHKEEQTINTMIPLWKKQKSKIEKEEYEKFYQELFFDMEPPLAVIHTSAEGVIDYNALLFIPKKAPYNYYSKNYEKGLRLYTNGVLIMDKCKDLLPDHFSFVKGLVDSQLTLNISRETIQQNRQLSLISKNLEKKIKSELLRLLTEDRSAYEDFHKAFGLQLKYGIYENYGAQKDLLSDLLLFHSVKQDKLITLDEYVLAMGEEQKYIYYAPGKTVAAVKLLPQCEKIIDCGYDVLCFTEDIDEFAIRMIVNWKEKEFRSVGNSELGLENETEVATEEKELTDFIKEVLGDKVKAVKLSRRMKSHPVCLTADGDLSIEMEKVLKSMPGVANDLVKAEKVLEINLEHPVFDRLKTLLGTDQEKLKDLSEILYCQAQIIEGLPVENPTRLADLVCKMV